MLTDEICIASTLCFKKSNDILTF